MSTMNPNKMNRHKNFFFSVLEYKQCLREKQRRRAQIIRDLTNFPMSSGNSRECKASQDHRAMNLEQKI